MRSGPSPRRRAIVAATLGLVALGGALSACGSSTDGGPATTTTRASGSALRERDADQLARMLFQNYQGQGAHVAISANYSDQITVSIEGDIDWAGHAGTLDVTSTFSDGRPQERQQVIYTEDAVYTRVTPEQANVLAQQGHAGVQWVKRAPQVDQRPLDQVIDLVASLAATRPDNPQLVAQGDLTFDRREDVDGRAANVYTSPKGASYWLDAGTGKMVRFQGTPTGFGAPVVVDVGRRGPVEVTVPDPKTVVDATLVAGS